MEDCFKLLHFHLGSQIPNIRIVKGALNEAARIYAELVKAGAGLQYLDVGGGWGLITTDRRRTSSRASTTRSRNTPTTSSITFRPSVMTRA